jgi:hypothetical protein
MHGAKADHLDEALNGDLVVVTKHPCNMPVVDQFLSLHVERLKMVFPDPRCDCEPTRHGRGVSLGEIVEVELLLL